MPCYYGHLSGSHTSASSIATSRNPRNPVPESLIIIAEASYRTTLYSYQDTLTADRPVSLLSPKTLQNTKNIRREANQDRRSILPDALKNNSHKPGSETNRPKTVFSELHYRGSPDVPN